MTTLTATAQPDTASIALTLKPTGLVTAIMRTDANGARPVRAQAGQLPTSSATVLIDNEAALDGTVTYTVVGGGGASASTAIDIGEAWLTVPVTPLRSGRLDLVTGYDGARASRTVVHQVIGRADPMVTLGPLELRTGALEVWCSTAAAARALELVYDRGEVVQLRQEIAGLDMYHVATATRVAPDPAQTDPRRWVLTVDYVEVQWPTGDQLGTLGWSVDDVSATYPTIMALAATYPTVNDLTIGPLT